MTQKKQTRGGARAGAGRPKVEGARKQISAILPTSQVAWLDAMAADASVDRNAVLVEVVSEAMQGGPLKALTKSVDRLGKAVNNAIELERKEDASRSRDGDLSTGGADRKAGRSRGTATRATGPRS